MQRYVVRRLLLFIPTLLLGSMIIFSIMRILPGDVALAILGSDEEDTAFDQEQLERYQEELGLTDPLLLQYAKWVWSMVNGEFGGRSLVDREGLASIIGRRLPVTLQLAALSFFISIGVSLPLGVLAALHQNRRLDYIIRVGTIAGLALPNFWVALMMIIVMVAFFSWSPPLFYVNVWESPGSYFLKNIWPALILSWAFSSYIARVTRSGLLEVLRQDYIRTAWSKGLSQRVVISRHALRNALIPVITLAGLQLGNLLNGSLILENIFGIPGIGQGIVESATARDYPVIQSLSFFTVALMLSLNLITDLVYSLVDPRISYSSR
jgi:peptide/nickel transport system permease protein